MSRQHALLLAVLLLLVAASCSPAATPTPLPTDDPTPTATSAPANAAFTPDNPATILRLDSYHADYLWSEDVSRGARRGLAEYEYSLDTGNIRVETFYMDTKRNTGADYFEAIAAEALAYIADLEPDLIIANDNNAVRLVVQPLAEAGIPIVFCGLNDEPETYGLIENPNVTGVLERAHVAETFSWIERVFPEATQITVLLDDSVTTDAYLNVVEAALAESPFAGSPIHTSRSFEEWQTLVEEAGAASEVLVIGTYHTLQDAEGQGVHEDVVMAWMVEHSAIPIVPFWDFSVRQGALGGSVISGDLQGYEAGVMAARILNGESPQAIPITTPQRGMLMLNRAAMDHWQVEIPLDLLELSTIIEAD